MGKMGREIAAVNVNELIELLNSALADEWFAYYQYWVGAKVVRGVIAKDVIAELEEHAAEELKHADMLVKRIVQLGGTPLLSPALWQKASKCGYAAPENPLIPAILDQNIKGERCAIAIYSKLLKFVEGKDLITEQVLLEILEEEVEHEDELQNMLENISTK